MMMLHFAKSIKNQDKNYTSIEESKPQSPQPDTPAVEPSPAGNWTETFRR